jgi:large subunit ribosomal protein L25
MSLSFNLKAESRNDLGKGASRRLRRVNGVPAVVYGGDAEPQSITLAHNEMDHALEQEAFYSHILSLSVDGGAEQQVILRDVQRHPYKRLIMHMDFQRVSAEQPIHVLVPLHFINEESCVGVKQGGGVISHAETEINVSCLPKDLPEFIEVDLINLNVGETLHLSDIQFPAGVTSVELSHGEDHDQAVVAVHAPRGGAAAEEAEGDAE